MVWRVEWEDEAVKNIKKLGTPFQRSIVRHLRQKIATDQNPRRFGDPLRKELKDLWKYRIGTYRIICLMEDSNLLALVVRVGHGRYMYNR